MVRTRFAPSPTGYLHIGGVRTALFNWLFARRHGGRFILRIDDTDAQRNVAEALAPILHGFRWLGLDWDEGPEVGGEHAPYFQSARHESHREAAEALVERGLAYWDYSTADELQAERALAQAEGRRFIYSRRFMAEGPAERARFEAQGRQGAVRLKMPREGSCRFTDLIRGEVDFEWAQEQDHVIQRADGTCLYHLASAVDDHAMAISHVIRAEEHLPNTPRQIFIMRGLGYALPEYAHLPQVAEPGSRNKLSKRKLERYMKNADFARLGEHGQAIAHAIGVATTAETFNPVVVGFYETVGYLPEALTNYLLLLGWSLDDKTEMFSRDEMIRHFSLDRVNKAPASFDPRKLQSFQERYMQALPVERRVELCLPYLVRAGLLPRPEGAVEVVRRIVEAAGDRIKVAGDILDSADFFVNDRRLTYDEAAVDRHLRQAPEAADLLRGFRDRLAVAGTFDAPALERLLREFVEARGVEPSRIVHALRLAVTGKTVGFGLFDTLSILGQDRSLSRIDRALELVRPA